MFFFFRRKFKNFAGILGTAGARTGTVRSNTNAHDVHEGTLLSTHATVQAIDSTNREVIGSEKGIIINTGIALLPSPIRIEVLEPLLKNYPDKVYLVEDFTTGFNIGYIGQHTNLISKNSISATENPEVVKEMINKERKLNRIVGPFKGKPLSSLALRQKTDAGKFSSLHNLSFPYDEQSVNENIPRSSSHVTYETIYEAIPIIQSMKPCWLAKTDIAEAFRLIPIHPSQYNLLGFKFKGLYYHDKCLPMGCSSSCQIFERFSNALKWIAQREFGIKNIVKVLDDFLFLAEDFETCATYLESFREMCKIIGVPLADHKTVGPDTCLTFLGFDLNTVKMEASLPREKIDRYKLDVKEMIENEQCSLRQLKSVLGKLQFATSIIRSGRCFLRRLYDLTIGKKLPHKIIRITDSAKEDLKIWHDFLDHFNGRTMLSVKTIEDSETLHMYTDSSKTGYGGTFRKKYIQGVFPPY